MKQLNIYSRGVSHITCDMRIYQAMIDIVSWGIYTLSIQFHFTWRNTLASGYSASSSTLNSKVSTLHIQIVRWRCAHFRAAIAAMHRNSHHTRIHSRHILLFCHINLFTSFQPYRFFAWTMLSYTEPGSKDLSVNDIMCASGSEDARGVGVKMTSCHRPGCWNVSFIWNKFRDKMFTPKY